MEFLRFGSRIAGKYWGCCAIDIIQDFNQSPDAPASIQIVSGDSGAAMGDKYLGKTQREVFHQRLRIGTFGTRELPNHAFFASLSANQIKAEPGKEWLAILREAGFEFLRAVDNSVYSGPNPDDQAGNEEPVYVFCLFRNMGTAAVPDPFMPPKEWTSLPEPKKDPETQFREGKTVFYTAKELIDSGVPVMKAGTMGSQPEDVTKKFAKTQEKQTAEVVSPWSQKLDTGAINQFLKIE